jgi:hypothetical protein
MYGLNKPFRFISFFILLPSLLLIGCKTMPINNGTSQEPKVGPGSAPVLAQEQQARQYPYPSSVHLDVVVPVFDPGIPEDYNEVEDRRIWPQLRRAEATRFAVKTRDALAETGVFASVNVVPSTEATAELYVLGKIEESNSEDVSISVQLVDIAGRTWGEKTFDYRVSPGFLRDEKNDGKGTYMPVFKEIADYVYEKLLAQKEKEKNDLTYIADMRFAKSFVPEAFASYLTTNDSGVMQVAHLPSQTNPMLRRMQPLMVQDQMFFDRLQNQYDAFVANTDDSYLTWQAETLPIAAAARRQRNTQMVKAGIGALMAVLGAQQSYNNSSNTTRALAGLVSVGGILLVGNSFQDGKEVQAHRELIDEMGESLDFEMSPHVMDLEGQTVELTGTAAEQYVQWRSHLKKIYALEQKPL